MVKENVKNAHACAMQRDRGKDKRARCVRSLGPERTPVEDRGWADKEGKG